MISPSEISACFITKEDAYPYTIVPSIFRIPFGELLFLTGCDSPHRKQELFRKAKFEYIYYQDDDCIAPISQLIQAAVPGTINCAMKSGHITAYSKSRIALLGWGSVFPKSCIEVLDLYRDRWGEDFLYCRETERIMTFLNYPQNRLDLPIRDLPSAFKADRLSMQPDHYKYIRDVEERCKELVEVPIC